MSIVEGWSPHPVRLVLTQAELLVIEFYPHRGSLLLAYDSNVVNFIYRNMVEEFGNHNIVAKIDRHLLSGIVAVKAEEPCRIRLETIKQTTAIPSTPEVVKKVIEFGANEKRNKWLTALMRRHEEQAAATQRQAGVETTQVVMLRGRPNERFQLLGRIESSRPDRVDSKRSLLIRAAVLGADAVLEAQEQELPGPTKNLWQASGTAVRSVTAAGHRQIGLLWFKETVQKTTGLMFAVAALSAALHTGLAEYTRATKAVVGGSLVETARIQLVCAVAILLPLILLRLLLWPQFARPAALACVLFVLWCLLGRLGFELTPSRHFDSPRQCTPPRRHSVRSRTRPPW